MLQIHRQSECDYKIGHDPTW